VRSLPKKGERRGGELASRSILQKASWGEWTKKGGRERGRGKTPTPRQPSLSLQQILIPPVQEREMPGREKKTSPKAFSKSRGAAQVGERGEIVPRVAVRQNSRTLLLEEGNHWEKDGVPALKGIIKSAKGKGEAVSSV